MSQQQNHLTCVEEIQEYLKNNGGTVEVVMNVYRGPSISVSSYLPVIASLDKNGNVKFGFPPQSTSVHNADFDN